MNYEELYEQFQIHEKKMKDVINNQQKAFKRLSKSMEKGDLKSATKEITLLEGFREEYQNAATSIRALLEGFDAKAYMESGEYARQMLEYFRQVGVDAKGEHFVYEVFPYKVKLDPENLELIVDRKRVQSLRPLSFVNDIKTSRDKLMNASFNPVIFANELAAAYDLAVTMMSKRKATAADADIYLVNLYKFLTPMRRFRRDYDSQSYAFDLARLYSSDTRTIDDGRRFQFGPSRNNSQAIRMLDKEGREQFWATIRFYNE